jgi:hypothetical protein
MKYGEKNYWGKRVDMGLVLLVMGISCGRIIFEILKIDQITVSYSFSYLLMIVGLFLIIDYKNLFSLRLPRLNNNTLNYIAFLLYIIFSLAFSERAEKANFFHMFFSLAAVLAISTQERNKTSEKFIEYMFWVGLCYTVYCGYLSTNGFKDFNFYSVQALDYGASKMSTTRGILYAFTAMILYKEKNLFEKCLKYLFVLCAVFTMMKVRVRTVLLSLCITIIVYIFIKTAFKGNKIGRKKLIQMAVSWTITIILVVLLCHLIPTLGNKIVSSVNTTVEAIGSFLSGDGSDYSAGVRTQILDWVKEHYKNKINIFNFIFGFTYTRYLDMPLLQAFFDFGLAGLLYVYYMVAKPLAFVRRTDYTPFQMFIVLFMVQNIIDQIAYMTPYEYQFHIRVIMMLQILMIEVPSKPGRLGRKKHEYFVCYIWRGFIRRKYIIDKFDAEYARKI